MVITDIEQLLNELRTPGSIGVRYGDGTVEKVDKEIINHAPIVSVIQELRKGNLISCPN